MRTWPLALFLLAACVLFFLTNVYMPLLQDDYWYNYMIGTDENGKISHLVTRISSWQDLLSTLYHHYFIMDGRLGNAFAHAVQFIGGKSLFNLLNTAMFLAFVSLTAKFCLQRVSLAAVGSVMTFAILLLPNPQGAILRLSGACGYLWGAVALVAFLSVLGACLEGRGIGRCRLLFGMAAGVLCGSIHEGLGAPLAAALVLYGGNLLLQRKNLLR